MGHDNFNDFLAVANTDNRNILQETITGYATFASVLAALPMDMWQDFIENKLTVDYVKESIFNTDINELELFVSKLIKGCEDAYNLRYFDVLNYLDNAIINRAIGDVWPKPGPGVMVDEVCYKILALELEFRAYKRNIPQNSGRNFGIWRQDNLDINKDRQNHIDGLKFQMRDLISSRKTDGTVKALADKDTGVLSLLDFHTSSLQKNGRTKSRKIVDSVISQPVNAGGCRLFN